MRCDDDAFADAVLAAATDAQAGGPTRDETPRDRCGLALAAGTECHLRPVRNPAKPTPTTRASRSTFSSAVSRPTDGSQAVAGAVMPSQQLYSIGDILLSIRPGSRDAERFEAGDTERGEGVERDQDGDPRYEPDHRRGGPVAGISPVDDRDVRQQGQQRSDEGDPADDRNRRSPRRWPRSTR